MLVDCTLVTESLMTEISAKIFHHSESENVNRIIILIYNSSYIHNCNIFFHEIHIQIHTHVRVNENKYSETF